MKGKISAFTAAFLLPAALALAVPSVSYAAGGSVVYDGGKKLKETDPKLEIPVVPGSTETTEIELRNSTDSSTNWYMSNEVLESIDDAGKSALGAAYTYTLSYRAPDGTDVVIYDSSRVGGSGSRGLLEVNESLGDGGYIFLGNLGKNEAGTVYLTIGLNGESGINHYQTLKGTLQTAFAMEIVPEGGGSGGGNTVRNVKKIRELTQLLDSTGVPLAGPDGSLILTTGNPKTGDNSRILLYMLLALTAGIGCAVLGIPMIRGDREEGERGDGKE